MIETLIFFFIIYPTTSTLCPKDVVITQSANVDYIAPRQFDGCISTETATIGEGIVLIGNEAFRSCTNLRSLSLPNSLKTIKDSAFISCNSLTSLVIPEGVVEIENSAFRECINLQSVSLPSTLEKLGMTVFQSRMIKLTNIVIAQGNKNYRVNSAKNMIYTLNSTNNGESTLVMCSNAVTDLTLTWPTEIPITIIESHCFVFCTLIKNIIFPNSVTTVKGRSLLGMAGLTKVHFGASVNFFEATTFDNCENLEEITVEPTSAFYTSMNGILFSKNMEELMIYPLAKLGTTYTVPKETKRFDYPSFFNTKYLKSFLVDSSNPYLMSVDNKIVFSKDGERLVKVPPNGVAGNFDINYYNNKIKTILHNETVNIRSIDVGAFATSQISSITFPSYLRSIGLRAFYESKLTSVVIPENIEYVGDYTFANCLILESFQMNCALSYLPEGLLLSSSKMTTASFSQSASDSIVSIGNFTFNYCTELKTIINFPFHNLKEIGYRSFYFCGKLPNLNFPESLEYIGVSAFESCISFTDIVIPKNVRLIDELAFSTCTKTTKVTLMNCNTIYKKTTFYSIPNLDKPVCIASKTFTSHGYLSSLYQRRMLHFFISVLFCDI